MHTFAKCSQYILSTASFVAVNLGMADLADFCEVFSQQELCRPYRLYDLIALRSFGACAIAYY